MKTFPGSTNILKRGVLDYIVHVSSDYYNTYKHTISVSCGLFGYVLSDYFSQLLDNHILDIGIFCPYVQPGYE